MQPTIRQKVRNGHNASAVVLPVSKSRADIQPFTSPSEKALPNLPQALTVDDEFFPFPDPRAATPPDGFMLPMEVVALNDQYPGDLSWKSVDNVRDSALGSDEATTAAAQEPPHESCSGQQQIVMPTETYNDYDIAANRGFNYEEGGTPYDPEAGNIDPRLL